MSSQKYGTQGRANFSARSRRILAQRAAYRCSNPRCGALTIGPGDDLEDVSDTGTAAHIFAAARGGPRGTGGLSAEDRTSIANGIWLCAACGRLVDANSGNSYPAPLLRSWRDLHEHRTRLEQGGFRRPSGWIQSLEVRDHFRLKSGSMQLSRCNLLFGPNESGKTQLLNLLRSMSHARPLMDGYKNAYCRIHWYDPDRRVADVEIRGSSLDYRIDGREVPLPTRPFRVLDFTPKTPHDRLTVGSLAASLSVERWTVQKILAKMAEVIPEVFSDVSFTNEEIFVSYAGEAEGPSVGLRDEGARKILFAFYALAVLAELQARSEPTILVLDDPFVFLHPRLEREAMRVFSSPARTFQTVLASHSLMAYALRNEGWTVTVLMQDSDSKSRISQDEVDVMALGEMNGINS